MRHGVAGRKLGRTTAHREAMLRNMAVSLIRHGKIQTTIQKAKELRVLADKLVTLGKREDSVHTRRLAFDRLRDRDAVQKLFQTLVPAFKNRSGGYTRILKLAFARRGDAADMALIEYLREDVPAVVPAGDKGSSKKAKSEVESPKESKVKKSDAKPAKAKSEKPAAAKAKKVTAKPAEKKAATTKKKKESAE